MPDNYFRAFSAEEIVAHLDLFRDVLAQHLPARRAGLRARARAGKRCRSRVTASSRSAPGIGSIFWPASPAHLPSPPLNILSADIFIRGDNLALDVFRVRKRQLGPVTDPREIATVESTSAYSPCKDERFDFAPLLAEVRRQKPRDAARKSISRPASASKTRAIPPAP